MIGGHADLYRKGLACEGHGFGIGAYGYYRRIVEDIIDNLLRSVAPLVPSAQRDAYDDALERLAETPVAKDKIALVKDLLPASLRPNNLNPLGVLYRALSEGLHAKTDEECLEWASHLRASLVFLALEVTAQADASAQFTASMQKVLDRYRSADEAPTAETQIAEPSDANANE